MSIEDLHGGINDDRSELYGEGLTKYKHWNRKTKEIIEMIIYLDKDPM